MLRSTTITAAALALLTRRTCRARAVRAVRDRHAWARPSAERLVQRGHRDKVAGAVLIGVGTALLVTSIALNVVDAVGPADCQCDYFAPTCSDGSARGPYYAGSMLGFATGVPLLGAGIATYIVGGSRCARARICSS